MKTTISLQSLKKATLIIAGVLLLTIIFLSFEIYVPINPDSRQTANFSVQKGWGDEEIAKNLKEAGLIRSSYFFRFYVFSALKHFQLQAGEYNLSPKMSLHQIANKMAQGDIIKDNVVIPEGWNMQKIGEYLQEKGICQKDYFVSLATGREGYLFPDTYQISKTTTCEDILDAMFSNFDRKLAPYQNEISSAGLTISEVVIMASLLEKEVITFEDKEIVSGILWKRLSIDMPLQVDATIVYITGKANISNGDKKIESPYNTYKYNGLPAGPIASPGLDSIKAAIFPKQTDYWYYLTDGKTIFSKTFEEHMDAKAKYLE